MADKLKYVSPEGGEAYPTTPEDEVALRAIGYVPEGGTPAPTGGPVRRYTVIAKFTYKGQQYGPGEVVELPWDEAQKRSEKLELISEE